MSRISGKELLGLTPLIMLCILTVVTNYYSGIPPEFPMGLHEPHGNVSEPLPRPNLPNSSLNLVSWRNWISDLIPPGPIFRVGSGAGLTAGLNTSELQTRSPFYMRGRSLVVSDSSRSDTPRPFAQPLPDNPQFRRTPSTNAHTMPGTPRIIHVEVLHTQSTEQKDEDVQSSDSEETLGKDPALAIHNHKPGGLPLRRTWNKWSRHFDKEVRRYFCRSVMPATCIILIGGYMYHGRDGGGRG